MQRILVNRYPFLLIDESQDTNKLLMDALFGLESHWQGQFSLGLIGDMMQRIYSDGKPDLGHDIPSRWAKPEKRVNRRCPKRVIALANDIRSIVDTHVQIALPSNGDGALRLFIAPSDTTDKPAFEAASAANMAQITADPRWNDPSANVKTLTLEHRMSAHRMGFDEMFIPLHANDRLSTGLLDGSLPALSLFTGSVNPFLTALNDNDEYRVMSILRSRKSPLLRKENLINPDKNSDPLAQIRQAVSDIEALAGNEDVTFLEILQSVAGNRLFPVPVSLLPFVENVDDEFKSEEKGDNDDEEEETDEKPDTLVSLRTFLETPYRQIEAYMKYVDDVGAFDTHQGVKGREFDRVMVVMDDAEAKGFTFSYDSLFNVKPESTASRRKRVTGEETEEDRTRRLFYVTCTRAEKSLALIAYTATPQKLSESVIEKGWFTNQEIVIKAAL